MQPVIATRDERQKFWTDVMNSSSEEMRDRLKASELLGKSEADFTENRNHVVEFTPASVLEEVSRRRERRNR